MRNKILLWLWLVGIALTILIIFSSADPGKAEEVVTTLFWEVPRMVFERLIPWYGS